jgi:anthranilate synthase/aminodeoxychorismate synthase-like glutamine amidotransferase
MEAPILILIIDHFDSFSHNLYQAFAQLAAEVVVKRCDEISLDDIRNMKPDLVVLSPGPKGPKDTGITLEYLKSPFAQTQATLGICLGLQAMGLHWGLEIELSKEVVHGKTCLLHNLNHPIFNNLQKPLQVARYHSLCLSAHNLPQNLNLLAQHESMVMAIEDQDKPWLGLQFHPESFLTTEGKSLLHNVLVYTQP